MTEYEYDSMRYFEKIEEKRKDIDEYISNTFHTFDTYKDLMTSLRLDFCLDDLDLTILSDDYELPIDHIKRYYNIKELL